MAGEAPTDPGTGSPAKGEPPKEQPSATDASDAKDRVSMPRDEFEKRLARSSESAIKRLMEELGVTDRAELARVVQERRRLEEEKKTDTQRLQEERDAKAREADEWKARAIRNSFESMAVRQGVQPDFIDYVIHEITSRMEGMTDDEISKFGNDSSKVAESVLDEMKKSKPAIFSGGGPAPAPPRSQPSPPSPSGDKAGVTDAFKMSDDEWRRHKEQLGIGAH